jgi:hypothetical protein
MKNHLKTFKKEFQVPPHLEVKMVDGSEDPLRVTAGVDLPDCILQFLEICRVVLHLKRAKSALMSS